MTGLLQYFPEQKVWPKDRPRYQAMGTSSGWPKEPSKNTYNLNGLLVLCPYYWPDKMKLFSSGGAHKGWKYYLVVIHNTYHGEHIETDH